MKKNIITFAALLIAQFASAKDYHFVIKGSISRPIGNTEVLVGKETADKTTLEVSSDRGAKELTVNIKDLGGKTLSSMKVNVENSQEVSVETSDISEGYIFEVKEKNTVLFQDVDL